MDDRERQNLHSYMGAFIALPIMAYGIVRLLFYLID